ncbi:hypothetical protein IM753_07320 [Moraxella sp. K127]|uniref:Uncharacterized protein n=1 Tax=Moraxella lacunata TaxID=477 RepID=A0A378QI46_MORLA|nr:MULTISPECIES: hypothetical protein [Moraxella]MBE9590791.1 hypothetical protein [Moraxella sp. K127]STZ00172.1 Uncharacterised protein [Moraxella lacunata]
MYQLQTNERTEIFHISSILITCEKYHQKSAFVFFKSKLKWYQTYFDENVLFIELIERDIDDHLSDFNEIKQMEIMWHKTQDLFLKYQFNLLMFLGEDCKVNFKIKDGYFYLFNDE